ncbi:unnamed protein product [Lampetra planeri]
MPLRIRRWESVKNAASLASRGSMRRVALSGPGGVVSVDAEVSPARGVTSQWHSLPEGAKQAAHINIVHEHAAAKPPRPRCRLASRRVWEPCRARARRSGQGASRRLRHPAGSPLFFDLPSPNPTPYKGRSRTPEAPHPHTSSRQSSDPSTRF